MTSSDDDKDKDKKPDASSGDSDVAGSQRSSSLSAPHTHGGLAVERDRRIKRMVDRVRSQMFHRK